VDTIEHIDEKGRKYRAFSNGEGQVIIKGPPENLVDELKLPEPFATTLHNILYARGIFTYADAVKNQKEMLGAYQEALLMDVQKLMEMYFRFDQGGRP
jgi:hypothetical protein